MAMAQITLNELIMAIFLFIEVPPLIFYYKILDFFARKKFTPNRKKLPPHSILSPVGRRRGA
jgi:hypothetical protein